MRTYKYFEFTKPLLHQLIIKFVLSPPETKPTSPTTLPEVEEAEFERSDI